MRRLLLLTALAVTMNGCSNNAPPSPIGQTEGPVQPGPLVATVATAPNAMVASEAALSTEVGLDILNRGGNAMDAAIAATFALAVVYPEAGNLGGGGFIVARINGNNVALDFREKAPLAATRDMFLDAEGKLTNKSLIGHLASGVPGSVAGLYAAHQRFGTMPWKDLIAPAIRLARDGFIVDDHLAKSIVSAQRRLQQFEGSAALFIPNGQPLAAGSTWKNPDLANSLQRIADNGPAGFYEGETARLIVAEMQRGGGLITLEDLKRYQAKWRDPVEFEYRGHDIISMPPASSGGITLAIMLNIAERFDLAKMGYNTADAWHVMAEASRRAFADRNHYLGDSDFTDIPRNRITSDRYAEQQARTISMEKASSSTDIRPGLGATSEPDQTAHLSVVDKNGNAVALTTTINELYGSAVTVTGAGFLLNDEMDDFSAKPGSPNMYGLVQGEANAIQPEKRMLSAMTPTIVLDRDGKPLIITGARGGPRIISAVAQVISNVIDYRMDLANAIAAPRIHHQHLPDVLYFEKDAFGPDLVKQLEAKGHTVNMRDGYVGSGPTIVRTANGWAGAPDPRSGGLAKGN